MNMNWLERDGATKGLGKEGAETQAGCVYGASYMI